MQGDDAHAGMVEAIGSCAWSFPRWGSNLQAGKDEFSNRPYPANRNGFSRRAINRVDSQSFLRRLPFESHGLAMVQPGRAGVLASRF